MNVSVEFSLQARIAQTLEKAKAGGFFTAIPLKAGDERLRVNGDKLPTPARLLSEENFQTASEALSLLLEIHLYDLVKT